MSPRLSVLQPGVALARRTLGCKGGNWGSARVRAGHLELLDTERRLVAPIPAAALSQVALPGKGELDLQFLDDDGTAGEREDEVLVEMRLYVPAGHSLPGVDMASEGARAKARAKARRGGSAAAAEGGEDDGECGEERKSG